MIKIVEGAMILESKKQVLILGASGFIGKHLTRYLNTNSSLKIYAHQGRRECDLTRPEDIKTLMSRIKPEYIIHLAALPDRSSVDIVDYNVSITKNILSQLPHDMPVVIIHAGSYKQYCVKSIPFHEESVQQPVNKYGESKVISENLMRIFCENHPNVRSILLRLGPVIGIGQPVNTLIPILINSIYLKNNEVIRVSDTMWDPTAVSDVVHAFALTLNCELPTNCTINLSYGVSHSPLSIAQRIAKIIGRPITLEVDANGYYPCLGNPSKAKRLLGWHPKSTIDMTLREIISRS